MNACKILDFVFVAVFAIVHYFPLLAYSINFKTIAVFKQTERERVVLTSVIISNKGLVHILSSQARGQNWPQLLVTLVVAYFILLQGT